MSNAGTVPLEGDRYSIFGKRVCVRTDRGELRQFVRDRWSAFYDPTSGPVQVEAVFYLIPTEASNPLKEWQFFNNGTFLIIGDDRRLVTAYFYRVPWQIHVNVYRQSDDYTYYYVFEPLLLMLLMRLNLLHWHSAAISREDRGVLIAGVSGSGKTTAALSFLRAGFSFLSDDEVFLQRQGDFVYALSAESNLYVTDRTLSMFPELLRFKDTPLVRRGHADKRQLRIKEAFPGATPDQRTAAVRVVLFPKVSEGEETTIHPLSVGTAMKRFLSLAPKEYPTRVTDPVAIENQLEIYATLARTAPSFDAVLGKDAEALPDMIKDFLS